MKYLTKFENHTQYEEARQNLILPNVSLCEQENEVHYNPLRNDIITYNASAKLAEITSDDASNDASDLMVGLNSTIEIDLPDEPPVPAGPGFHINAFSGASGQLTITKHTFENGIGTIEFNGDIISIGEQAFSWCTSLTSITIPNSVTSIGERAFQECTSLVNINIPNGVTSIGEETFFKCSNLTSCTIGSGVISIGYAAFYYCYGLTNITIPNSVTSIGENAFMDCSSLTSITSNATTAPTIQNNTFWNVKAGGTLTVPSGATGYDTWMGTGDYYLGKYNWTKVEQ